MKKLISILLVLLFAPACEKEPTQCWTCTVKVYFRNPSYPPLKYPQGTYMFCDVSEMIINDFVQTLNVNDETLIQTCECKLN